MNVGIKEPCDFQEETSFERGNVYLKGCNTCRNSSVKLSSIKHIIKKNCRNFVCVFLIGCPVVIIWALLSDGNINGIAVNMCILNVEECCCSGCM